MFVYLDDIIVFAKDLDEHEKRIDDLMERLRKANLQLQPDKCNFLRPEVNYLGHIISREGLKPDPLKLEAVQRFPVPKKQKNIREFLGLTGYYRRFIKSFSQTAKLLTKLLEKDADFVWTPEAQNSFEVLKESLCTTPVLQYPDFSKPFIITTDASGIAVGAVLSQGEIGKDRPIAYYSRVLRGAKLRYGTYEREALAIVQAVKNFRPYVYGRALTIVTDHKPLVWFRTAKDGNARVLKWRLRLAEYEYTVVHKPGKIKLNADALSRNPIENVNVTTRAQEKFREQESLDSRLQKIIDSVENVETVQEATQDSVVEPPKSERGRPRKMLSTSPELDSDPVNGKSLIGGSSCSKELINPGPHLSQVPGRAESPEMVPGKIQDSIIGPSENSRGRPRKVVIDSENFREAIWAENSSSDSETSHGSDSNTEDKSSSDVELQSPVVQDTVGLKENEVHSKPPNIVTSRELFQYRPDSLVYFLDSNACPCDNGSQALKRLNKLPVVKATETGQVTWSSINKKHYFGLVILKTSGESSIRIQSNIGKTLVKLKGILRDKSLKTFSIAFSEYIANVLWVEVLKMLVDVFEHVDIKVIICLGKIRYVPPEERDRIFFETHNSPLGGHKGVSKTYQRIKNNYFWENLKDDIQRRIQQCPDCQLKNLVRIKTRQPMLITDTPGTVFEKIAMDIVDPLPVSDKGNEYILTMHDLLSKFCIAIPIQNMLAITIADVFIKRFICLYGAPKALLTDQGRNFVSTFMQRIAKRFRIKKIQTTAFRPQSNGSLERSHHVLGEFLKQYVEKEKDWDDWLEIATFSYNTSMHEGTKYTPFELVNSRTARVPTEEPLHHLDRLPTYDNYICDLVKRLIDIRKLARENLITAKEKSKIHCDQNLKLTEFKENDLVFLLRGPKPNRFGNHYDGPYQVLEVLPNGNIKLEIKNQVKTIHPNRLKLTKISDSKVKKQLKSKVKGKGKSKDTDPDFRI